LVAAPQPSPVLCTAMPSCADAVWSEAPSRRRFIPAPDMDDFKSHAIAALPPVQGAIALVLSAGFFGSRVSIVGKRKSIATPPIVGNTGAAYCCRGSG
jgi:hypothetical protein